MKRNVKMKLLLYIQIFTIMILSWFYSSRNDACCFIYNIDGKRCSLDMFTKGTNRLLANDILQNKLTKKNLDYGSNYKLIGADEDRSIYTKLKQGTSNNLEVYKKRLKRNYSKKNRLKKFDCYYEEKIFNGIEKFDKVADNMNSSKRNFCKIIFRKFALRLVFFCYFVGIGIIIPTLEYIYSCFKTEDEKKKYTVLGYIESKLGIECIYICYVLIFTLCLVIISVILYTTKKIIKYDTINAGNSKMKYREYIRYMKRGYRHK